MAQLLGEVRAIPGDFFQHHLENQASDGVEIARERFTAEPQRLQGDRATTSEWVNHQRQLFAMRCLH
jgi:hypothetical protein